MSDGSRKQPMQARLSATGKGAPPSSAMAAVLAASLSAFSAVSAARTSLVAAPRSGCCCRSLASSGLKPRSGSATRSPRTASRRASGVQGSPMRGAPGAREAAGHSSAVAVACRTASPKDCLCAHKVHFLPITVCYLPCNAACKTLTKSAWFTLCDTCPGLCSSPGGRHPL
eukprot:scaffold25995_cov70-Phaeocystis_antarctica.AAC.2